MIEHVQNLMRKHGFHEAAREFPHFARRNQNLLTGIYFAWIKFDGEAS